MKLSLYLILTCLVSILGCEKENYEDLNGPSNGYIYSFISLTAEKDTLIPGGSTKITARVDGDGIKYSWSATQGEIFGLGNEITYVAPTCACGRSVVICRAKAASREISRSIIIYLSD